MLFNVVISSLMLVLEVWIGGGLAVGFDELLIMFWLAFSCSWSSSRSCASMVLVFSDAERSS